MNRGELALSLRQQQATVAGIKRQVDELSYIMQGHANLARRMTLPAHLHSVPSHMERLAGAVFAVYLTLEAIEDQIEQGPLYELSLDWDDPT